MEPISNLIFQLSSLFTATFDRVLGALDFGPVRTLYGLLCLGRFGVGAGALRREFLELGVLHLLVLSGSQVGAFARVWRAGWAPVSRMRWGGNALPAIEAIGLALFLTMVRLEAPIVRAALMEGLRIAWPRLPARQLPMLAFAVHVALFPEHATTLSFYLSWVCWLALAATESLQPRWGALVLLTVTCQACAIFLTDSPWPSARGWVLLVVANIALLKLFEAWIFPLCGFVACLAIVFAPIEAFMSEGWALDWVGETVRPILNGAGTLVLVAINSLRYIH